MTPQSITLIIKNPASTLEEDYRFDVPFNTTVLGLKQQLRLEYQGQPNTACQRLIYSGQVLKDELLLTDIFKNQDLEQPQILHLVVKPSPDAPSPLYRSPNPSSTSLSSPSSSSFPHLPANSTAALSHFPVPSTQNTGASSSSSGARATEAVVNGWNAGQSSGYKHGMPPPASPIPTAPSTSSPGSYSSFTPLGPAPSLNVHTTAMTNPVYAAAYYAALAVLSAQTPQASNPSGSQEFNTASPIPLPNMQGFMWMNSASAYYQQFPRSLPSIPGPTSSVPTPNNHATGSLPFQYNMHFPRHPPFVPPPYYGAGAGLPGYPGPSYLHNPSQFPHYPNHPRFRPENAPPEVPPQVPPALAAVLPPGVTLARVRVVRIDVMLLLKLAAVVFILTQDGSRTRFYVICAAAVLFYLHQTGVIRPFQNWFVPQIVGGRGRALLREANLRNNVVAQDGALGQENAPNQDGAQDQVGANSNSNSHNIDGEESGSQHVDGVSNTPLPPRDVEPRVGWLGMIGQEARVLLIGFFTSLMPGFNPAQHIIPGVAVRNHQD